MNISKIIKKTSKILFVVLLFASLLLSNFPTGVFDYFFALWQNRKIADTLYLSRIDRNVVDNFVPVARAVPGTRVRTVEFFAGQDAGSATNDNQNAQNNFTSQTFSLAESTVDIIDAYVEVSAEIGATTATTYNESFIFFDACVPTCTPSPVAFTTTAGLGTNSAEAQTIRFRANVTSETEIAAYTGGGANRTFRVGYCFDTTAGGGCAGTAAANIQGANAKLVITYTYEDTSSTQTNTVIYPLESASGVGSKTAAQAACTVDSNCPAFSYNAEIPEISSQLSQWFYLQTSLNGNLTTDWQTISDIGGNPGGANTPIVYFEEALSQNGGWVNVLRSGVAGYANNSSQSLEMSTNGSNAYVMGGENYVTYTYSNAAATKTKTVVFPVGEVITAAASTAKSALTGPTVYFPETGVTVKKAWFRVHTSMGGNTTAGTLAITTKVGNNAETGQTSYSLAADTQGVSDDGYFIHLISSADYAELQAATASSGKTVQMTAQWTLNARGAVSAELVITYTYTSDSNGYLVTQNLFAGQQTAAPATSYTTATGAIDPKIAETTGTVTIRGASIKMSGKNTGTTANEAMGANLTTSTCTSTNTSTAVTDTEITRIMLWKDVSSVVTNNDVQTYTACYSSAQASVFTGILIIVYQWDAPVGNQAPTVDSVSISPSPTINLNADTTKTVTITATITDDDGCEDVFVSGSITGVFFDDAVENDTCTQDDNDCYASLTLTEVDDTCTGAGDYTADASVNVSVWFIANPSSQWTAKVTATDAGSLSGSNTQTVTINTLNAFKLDTSSIAYSTVNPNQVSSQQAVLITTTGNAAVDVKLSGTNLSWSGNEILVGQQKYSATSGFDWETQGTALTGTATCHELSSGKPTAHPSNQTEYVYWKLKVPTGKPAGGPYSGSNYFDVVSEATCP